MHKFRLMFSLVDSTYINTDDISICLQADSGSCTVTSYHGKKINESSKLIVVGTGFNSTQEAYSKGQTIMNILRLYSLVYRTGVNLGNNMVNGGISNYFKDKIYKEIGIVALNEVNGLMAYEDEEHIKIASVSLGNGMLYKSLDGFKEIIESNYDKTLVFSDKVVNAIDFYNLTMFTTTPRLKFLLLVIAIEALIETKRRASVAVEHVVALVKLTEDNLALSGSERSSMLGSLKYLKNQSISQSGRELVEEMLGEKIYNSKPASKFFTQCYNMRSSLVHNGTWDESNNALAYELERMVVDLLIAKVRKEHQAVI